MSAKIFSMDAAILQLQQADPILAQILERLTPQPHESTQNVFHDLMSCILEQQIHYRSTKNIFSKLLQKASIDQLSVENFELLEERALSNLKLSLNKQKTILACLEFFSGQNFDWQSMTEEEIKAELGQIKGVGQWTIDMILIYTLGRPNIFPKGDYHLKKVMASVYGLDSDKTLTPKMNAIAETWSPYKSIAFKYLLAWKERKESLII